MMDIVYKIKDSVDLFLTDESVLTVYYMNTRRRKTFQVSGSTVFLIEQLCAEQAVRDIIDAMNGRFGIPQQDVMDVIATLEQMRIITRINPKRTIISQSDSLRFDRQINYLQEFFQNEEDGILAQKKLIGKRILLLGCGAVGGDIAVLLAMAGIRGFTLYDSGLVKSSDLSRHMYYQESAIGMQKTEALLQALQRIDKNITGERIDEFMGPSSDIRDLIAEADFVINTLDVPYIGYTAAKISRVCMELRKAHYIAGGFDAHLASTGELIIPFVTPCVECYASHFKTSLENWKPKPHPVKNRSREIGGIASMSLFSASFAAIEIIKFLAGLCDIKENYKIRGEFLFDEMDLTYLTVERDPSCVICGGSYES